MSAFCANQSNEVKGMDETQGGVIEIAGLGVIELAEWQCDEEVDAKVREEFERMGVDPDEEEGEATDEL